MAVEADKVLLTAPVVDVVVGVNAANAGRGAVPLVVVAAAFVCTCWWGNGCTNVNRVLGMTCVAGGMTASISDER